MFNVPFPSSNALYEAVDGQAVLKDEGAGSAWNPYDVNVPFVFNNQWKAFSWALLPSLPNHQDGFSQWDDVAGTPSQYPLTPNNAGFASHSDQTDCQIDPSHRSYSDKLQSSEQENEAKVPPSSPSSSYDQLEHKETTMESPKKQPRRQKKPPSDKAPATKSSRRNSNLDQDANQLRKNHVRLSSVPRDDAGCGSTESNGWRNKKLESNRQAANRSRIRKREDNEKLKSAEKEMKQQHTKLSGEVEALIAEIHQLKCELLRHSDCNCTLIQTYVKNECRRYIRGISKRKLHPECR